MPKLGTLNPKPILGSTIGIPKPKRIVKGLPSLDIIGLILSTGGPKHIIEASLLKQVQRYHQYNLGWVADICWTYGSCARYFLAATIEEVCCEILQGRVSQVRETLSFLGC